MSKTISIIIPLYNPPSSFFEIIEYFKMEKGDFEIILVDDGSKTNIANKIKDSVSNDGRFSYFYQENKGIASARNKGLELASGQYIGWIDCDDSISPYYLKSILLALKNNSNTDALYIPYKKYNDKEPFTKEEPKIINLPTDTIYKKKTYCYTYVLKKEFYKDIVFPIGYIYEDAYAFSFLITKIKNIKSFSNILYGYKIHDQSLTRATSGHLKNLELLLLKLKRDALDKNSYEWVLINSSRGVVRECQKNLFQKKKIIFPDHSFLQLYNELPLKHIVKAKNSLLDKSCTFLLKFYSTVSLWLPHTK